MKQKNFTREKRQTNQKSNFAQLQEIKQIRNTHSFKQKLNHKRKNYYAI